MHRLTAEFLSRACRTFLRLAYPDGPESIPPKKRVYYNLPDQRPVEEFLPPAAPADVCQVIAAEGGGLRGFAFRLGSAHFPHLKLKLQLIDHNHATLWVCTVDTHDAYSKDSIRPPASHPDADAWTDLQRKNRQLKERIEAALEHEGLVTFNTLLRRDLNNTGQD
jgi:hypothetical protein